MEPAKTPKLAPFFLPTLPGLQPKFLPSEEGSDIPVTEAGGGSKILNLGELNPLLEFQKCLQQCAGSNQCEYSDCYDEFATFLQYNTLPPTLLIQVCSMLSLFQMPP